VKLMQPVPSTK